MKDALLLALARLADSVLLLRPDHAARQILAFATAAARPESSKDQMHTAAMARADFDPDAPAHPWNAREAVAYTADGVAVIRVSGTIVKGVSALVAWYFGFARLEAIDAALDEIANRGNVRAIVFAFDSPGGYTTGVEECAASIAAASSAVPTFAYSDTMCCSAAYWLASQCSGGIVAANSADIGCVGTYMALYDYSAWLEQQGIKLHLVRAGNMKGLGVFGKELTEEERAFLQAEVDAINAQFLAAVHEGRHAAGAPAIAEADLQGQWFSGRDAVTKGLADSTAPSLGAFLATLGATLAEAEEIEDDEEETPTDEAIEDVVTDGEEAADETEDGTVEDEDAEESTATTDEEEEDDTEEKSSGV